MPKNNKSKLEQSDITFNVLQNQHHYLTYTIQQIENSIQENLEYFYQQKKGLNEYSKFQLLNTKNSLDNLIRKMILKIQDSLQHSFKQNCNKFIKSQYASKEHGIIYKNKSMKQFQLENIQNTRCIKLQNQKLQKDKLQLKKQCKDLKNSLIVLNEAYLQSKMHYEQEIKEFSLKLESYSQTKGNPYQLNIPGKFQRSGRDLQSTKNGQFGQQSQKSFMRKSNNDIQIVTVRTKQVRSAKGCVSIASSDSKKQDSIYQLKIKRLNQENKRIKDFFNQTNYKLKISSKNNENLMKQLQLLQCQKIKLEYSNNKKKIMIEQLMKRIEEKYQISV